MNDDPAISDREWLYNYYATGGQWRPSRPSIDAESEEWDKFTLRLVSMNFVKGGTNTIVDTEWGLVIMHDDPEGSRQGLSCETRARIGAALLRSAEREREAEASYLVSIRDELDSATPEELANERRERETMLPAPQVAVTVNPGFIYILSDLQGHYKIGRTVKLEQRIMQLKIQLPYRVELVHSIASNDIVYAEQKLHTLFAHCRMNGEWFKLAEHELDALSITARIDREPSR